MVCYLFHTGGDSETFVRLWEWSPQMALLLLYYNSKEVAVSFLKVGGNCLWKAARGTIRCTWKNRGTAWFSGLKVQRKAVEWFFNLFESWWIPNFTIWVLMGGLLGQCLQLWAFPNPSAKRWGNWIRINKRSCYRNRCWHGKGIPAFWLLTHARSSGSQCLFCLDWVRVIT